MSEQPTLMLDGKHAPWCACVTCEPPISSSSSQAEPMLNHVLNQDFNGLWICRVCPFETSVLAEAAAHNNSPGKPSVTTPSAAQGESISLFMKANHPNVFKVIGKLEYRDRGDLLAAINAWHSHRMSRLQDDLQHAVLCMDRACKRCGALAKALEEQK